MHDMRDIMMRDIGDLKPQLACVAACFASKNCDGSALQLRTWQNYVKKVNITAVFTSLTTKDMTVWSMTTGSLFALTGP